MDASKNDENCCKGEDLKENQNESKEDNEKAEVNKQEQENKEGDQNEEPEVEEILSEEVKLTRREDALSFKNKGNEQFKENHLDEAIQLYSEGLTVCPKCFSKDLAVLFGNRGACYVKLQDNNAAIEDCTSALEHDPNYMKVRLRRAQTYEKVDKLEQALEDYKEVLKLDPRCQPAGEAVLRLPQQINERNEKLKAEMFKSLKDLGNMCLKPFGLSTDNFQFTQDPNTGGYSMNFQR